MEGARAAGVAAIGYGVSNCSPAVPEELIGACREFGIVLVEVPEDMSFSTIGERLLEHNHSEVASVRLQLTRHYRLDKIAQLTGRSVDSAESRVDFALALAIPRG